MPCGAPFSVTTSDDASISNISSTATSSVSSGRIVRTGETMISRTGRSSIRSDSPLERRSRRVPRERCWRIFHPKRIRPARIAALALHLGSNRDTGHVVEAEDTDCFVPLDDRKVRDVILTKDIECVSEGGRRADRDEIGGVGLGDGRRVEERLDLPEDIVDGDDADQLLAFEHRE